MAFIDHSDQRPEWKLIPSDWVPRWWPMGNDLMASSSAVPQSHCQKSISNSTLWFSMVSDSGCLATLGAEPRAAGCPLLYAEENKALHRAREEKLPQAGCQHASVLLCSTYLCFSISVSKTHTGTGILPDFSVPSWAPGFMLSLLVTLQTNCTFCVCS